MRFISVCSKCNSKDIKYLGNDKCYCNKCNCETETADRCIETPFERNERRVYATGNRWAIENWKATHY